MVNTRRIALAILACLAGAQHAAAVTLLVEFTSPDCGPCRSMRPVIEQLMAEGHQVRHVDVSTRPELAQQFRVTRWPTFLVLVDGVEQSRHVGLARHSELVEMLRSAGGGGGATAPAKRTPAMLTSNHQTPSTFASAPEVGRIVDLQNPSAQSQVARGPASAASAGTGPLTAATVRITVSDPEGHSTGTGSIVDAREGEALVLTCGHLFRASGGQGAIELSLFTEGPGGAEVQGKVTGVLVDFDLDRDLALVRFSTNNPVAVTPIAPPGTVMQPGVGLTSVGCNNGDNPTARSTQVTAIDRYVGHPNIEAAGAPVEGRSGGGLFNAQGQLVGVCYAADPQCDEGLYASLPSIYAKLDSLGLSKVYREPSLGSPGRGQAPANPTVAAATPPATPAPMRDAVDSSLQIRGQNPVAEPTSPFVSQAPLPTPIADVPAAAVPAASVAAAPATAASLSPQEQAALEEIRRRGADAEVICIIRPRSGDGASEVIKIPSASPAFVQALSSAQGPAPARTAAAPGQTPAAGGTLMR